jgi:hypothetical protein
VRGVAATSFPDGQTTAELPAKAISLNNSRLVSVGNAGAKIVACRERIEMDFWKEQDVTY